MIWRALAVGFAVVAHEHELESVRARALCAVDTAAAARCNDQLIVCDAWRDTVSHSLAVILHLVRGEL